jgi:hypothetical protein
MLLISSFIRRYALPCRRRAAFYTTDGELAPAAVPALPDRVLERDIQVFTAEAGCCAHRVRTPVQEQLQCMGGEARHLTHLMPRLLHFTNQGVDDQGHVNWKYEAPELDARVSVTLARVSFEGYERAGDPYVRVGSGVARYELAFAPGAAANGPLSASSAPRPHQPCLLSMTRTKKRVSP